MQSTLVKEKSIPRSVKVTHHYWEEDTEFMEDYVSVDIEVDDLGVVATFGQAWDEDSGNHATGWVEAFTFLNPDVKVTYVKVADAEM